MKARLGQPVKRPAGPTEIHLKLEQSVYDEICCGRVYLYRPLQEIWISDIRRGTELILMFNLMELNANLSASVVTAVGDDENGRLLLDACARRGVDARHVTVVPGGRTALIEMLLNRRPRPSSRGARVMPDYQPSGADMDFIRAQDYIHTDLSWRVVDLLPDMRKNGAKIYFDFSKRYQHPDVDRVLKNIDYGIFSFEEETQEVRELLLRGCSLGAKTLIATFVKRVRSLARITRSIARAAFPPHGGQHGWRRGFLWRGLSKRHPRWTACPECMQQGRGKIC